MKRNDYEKLVKPLSRFSLKKELSYKQTHNILKHIATDIKENDIIAFYDVTFSNNGKEGTLIAKNAIYCDYKNAKVPFKGLKEITNIKKNKASITASFVYEDEQTINCFLTTGTEIDVFLDVLRKIVKQYNNTFEEVKAVKQVKKAKEETIHESDADKALKLYYQAKELYDVKKYKEAFPIFLQSAKLGDEYSAGFVGYMYETAMGIEQNLEEAFHWYHISAKKGIGTSIDNVSRCYYYGIGVEKNNELAALWSEKGAEKNIAGCLYRLGQIYKESNPDKSFECYKKAADLNHTVSQGVVGNLYLKKNDIDNALIYLNKAANQNYRYAFYDLGEIYRKGLGHVTKDLNKAIDYFKKSADLGYNYAYYILAFVYLHELKDLKLADDYANVALEKGVDFADNLLVEIEEKKKQQDIKKQESVVKKEEKQSQSSTQKVEKQPIQKKESIEEHFNKLKSQVSSAQYKTVVDIRVKGLCETCQMCSIDTCPVDALSFVNGIPVINNLECMQCGICVDTCPYGFIKIIK